MKMKLRKPKLSINLDAIQEGELQYFFRPFVWRPAKYTLLWDANNPQLFNDENSESSDESVKFTQSYESAVEQEVSVSTLKNDEKKPVNESERNIEILENEEDVINVLDASISILDAECLANNISQEQLESPQEQQNLSQEKESTDNKMHDILASYRDISKRYKS